MSTLLSPVVAVLTAVLARAHALASGLGLPPESMAAWLLALAILVACVRTAMLPLVVHGVRASHARARALPQLAALQRRYAGRRPRARRRDRAWLGGSGHPRVGG